MTLRRLASSLRRCALLPGAACVSPATPAAARHGLAAARGAAHGVAAGSLAQSRLASGVAGRGGTLSLALDQLRTKDALVERLSAQVSNLLAWTERKVTEADELKKELDGAKALTRELDKAMHVLLRVKGIHSARGALELLLDTHTECGKESELAAYLARPGDLGARTLECANAERKVLNDNGGRPHSPESLAKLIMNAKRRLNKDAHDKRTPDEYVRDNDSIVLRRDGLSESDVAALLCLFRTHHYPVHVTEA